MFKLCSISILRQYLVILTANLNIACLALYVAWSSSMLVKLKDGHGTGLPRPITDEEGSWIASIGTLVSLPFLLVMGLIIDKIGRRTCLVLGCIPRILSYLILTFASEVWMVLLGRAIDGLSITTAFTVVATYSSEIASTEIRGALGTTIQASSATGMLISFSIAPFLPYFYVNLMYLCIAIMVCVPIWLLPESPYYLYSKGRKEESLKVLKFLRDSEILAYDEIGQYELLLNKSEKMPSVKEILGDVITLKSLAKVIFMSILLEVIGYNAVLFYMMPIFQMTQTSLKEETGSIVIGCIQLIACVLTIFIADKFGRKSILIITLLGMTIGMTCLGTFFYLKEHDFEISGALNYMPLISIVLVIFSFNAGLGSLFWMVVAELFNSTARAIGVSASAFTASIFIFLSIKYFVFVVNSFGPTLTFWIFSIICIITTIFIIFFIPETKGKTFLTIQMELGRNVRTKS